MSGAEGSEITEFFKFIVAPQMINFYFVMS
jgi:hypothetical protein